MKIKTADKIIIFLTIALVLNACSATKYVPDGQYLLDKVSIESNRKSVKEYDFQGYLRQDANSRWFSLIKVPLYLYDLSGRDSSWINRTLRKIGEAPVIYNEKLAKSTCNELVAALNNMGYLGASAEMTTMRAKKKMDVIYRLSPGEPYIVKSLSYDIEDAKVADYLKRDSAASLLSKGMNFDMRVLDAERDRIATYLTSNGYYQFNKEFITFTADTTKNTKKIDLTMHLSPYRKLGNGEDLPHQQFTVKSVSFVTEYNVLQSSQLTNMSINDSVVYKGYPLYFKDKLYIRPRILLENNYIRKGELFNESATQRTYSSLNRLSALKYTNIKYFVNQHDTTMLDCYILTSKSKSQSLSFELEGTNSEGDLGMAASVTAQHRNLFHGSETFSVKLRGAYEAISGLQNSLSDNYTEYGVETNIHFPRFLLPFTTTQFRNNIPATTVFGLQFDYQQRPEYARTIFSGAWSYQWSEKSHRMQHRFDLGDISYIYIPWISSDFEKNYLTNSILKYNYKDQLILRMGYGFSYSSVDPTKNFSNNISSYTIRFNIESAGNLLYGISKLFSIHKNSDDKYAILNIGYEQYLKGDVDFAKRIVFDKRNTLAFHSAFGLAVPYGNSKQMPFIKRYFSGGANSVRGWSVRDLGPGAYKGGDTVDFMNRSGDIKMDANVEYRSRLFWHFCGAAFVDMGNIWTIKKYDGQEDGEFRFDKFYKQFAVAYGLGLRLDFQYFVLRFDGGMKAVNPAGTDRWSKLPFYHPSFSRDFAFHFAVGYPF